MLTLRNNIVESTQYMCILKKKKKNPLVAVTLQTATAGDAPQSPATSSISGEALSLLIMYGKRAAQLLGELASSEHGHLNVFNSDSFDQVIKECNEHHVQLQSLMRKMQDDGLDIQTAQNADHFGAVIHHLSLIRNKRCLMAYVYNRAEVIRSFLWDVGPLLPHGVKEKLNYSEEEYFSDHSSALETYMSDMDIDLTEDKLPPKVPYIQVRVLDDIGDVSLGDQTITLLRNSVHSLLCTDAEPFISQDLMEEFQG